MSKHKVFIEPGHNEFTFKVENSKGGKYTDGIFEEFVDRIEDSLQHGDNLVVLLF